MMMGTDVSPNNYQIKICPTCPSISALRKVLVSWGTKYPNKYCLTCRTTLLVHRQVSLYDSSRLEGLHVRRVKVCNVCPLHQAGLSVSWTGSVARHDSRWDCRHRHGYTSEYVDEVELQKLYDEGFLTPRASTVLSSISDKGTGISGLNDQVRTDLAPQVGNTRSTSNSPVAKKRRISLSAVQRYPKKIKQDSESPEQAHSPPFETLDPAQTAKLTAIKPKKTLAETRLDIALAIATKLASQTTPEHGEPILDCFGPEFVPPPPRSSALKRRASEIIYATRNERSYKELTASRRVSFANYVEIRDDDGRTIFLMEDTWKERPRTRMIDRVLYSGRNL